MTHLPFIAASYALGIGVPALFALTTWNRLRTARRRLAAVDPRGSRDNVDPRGSRDNVDPRGSRDDFEARA